MRSLTLFLALALPALAQNSILDDILIDPWVGGFDSPTSIKHAGDGSGRLFVTEQPGRIRIIRGGALEPTPFLDITGRVQSGGERGLLDVAFHPQFESNGLFWVNYADSTGRTVVSSFSIGASADQADPSSESVFLRINQPFRNHNGGQIEFGPDGYLYIATGDGGSGGDPGNRAQSLSNLLGKILRVDVDQGAPARIPPDNPFVGTSGSDEIWVYGLRNPWRFSFDRLTGDMFIGDVGQNAVEEISFQAAGSAGGENYGWRRMEGSSCFDPSSNCNDGSLVLPILEYRQGVCGSVTGGYRYRGEQHPALQGVYLFAEFCEGDLYAGTQSGGRWTRLGPRPIGLGVSTFGEDEAGELYLADYGGGTIYRISLPSAAPHISAGGVVSAAGFSAAGGLAPGTIVSIFGQALAGREADAASVPLPTELAGSGFAIGGQAAPIFFVSPGQANVQIPWEVDGLAQADAFARSGDLVSAAETISLAPFSPGVFTLDQSGSGQAAVLIAGSGGAVAAPAGSFPNARPARIGETLEIFAAGLGSVSNRPATGAASPTAPLSETLETPTVIVDVEPARVLFSGLTPGFVGLYQVNAQLVGDFPSGDEVPLRLLIGGTEANPTTVAIE